MAWSQKQREEARQRMRKLHETKRREKELYEQKLAEQKAEKAMATGVPSPEAGTYRAPETVEEPKVEPEEKVELEVKVEEEAKPVEKSNVSLTQEQFDALLAAVSRKQENGEVQNQSGVTERFPLNPEYYKNPLEELYDTPKFRRYALRENFEIDYKVHSIRYQTATGAWFVEPRFEITLYRKQYDEEGNEKKAKIVLGRASFFEDPPANLQEAHLAGLFPEDHDPQEFANKMRMFRFRNWIEDQLNPRRPKGPQVKRNLEVIGGKVYEIEEKSEEAAVV